MKEVIPRSYIVGQTDIFPDSLRAYIDSVCDQHCVSREVGAEAAEFAYEEILQNVAEASAAEALCAFMGRMCYRSFYPDLNPNVTKVREGIKEYMLNILKSGHGSILENANVSVLFHNVSRVFCYHPETEIYTKDGWKKVSNIADDELLLVKNPETGKSYFSRNKKLHSFDFNGELYGYKNNQMVSPLVNGAHLRWAAPYDLRKNRGLNNDAIVSNCEKLTAEYLFSKRFVVDHKITRNDLATMQDELDVAGCSFDKLTFAKFLGFLATDGSISKDLDHVSISQTKEHNKEVLRSMFGNMFKKYGEYRLSDRGLVEFRFHNPDFAAWCADNIGRLKCERKLSNFIMDSDLAFKEAFIEGLLLGDGNTHLENGHQVLYCQTKEAASQYQILFAELGNSSNIREVDRTGESHEVNGVACTYTKPYFVLSIHRKHSTLVKHGQQFRQSYSGKIFCPQTEEGVVLVRNKGVAVWDCNTHELVRHRAGCAMSQESLRYVRLNDLGLWLPPEIKEDEHLANLFRTTFENLEQIQTKMTDYLGFEGETEEAHYRRFITTVLDPGAKLDPFDPKLSLSYLGAENEEAYRKWAEHNPAKKPITDFAVKKAYTSAMRRLAPDGLATSIGFTGNFRAWRHILAMRSSPHAEVEMRAVMIPLAVKFREQFPAVFQDMEIKYKGALVPPAADVTSQFLGPFCSDLVEHAEENFIDYEVSFKYPKV